MIIIEHPRKIMNIQKSIIHNHTSKFKRQEKIKKKNYTKDSVIQSK